MNKILSLFAADPKPVVDTKAPGGGIGGGLKIANDDDMIIKNASVQDIVSNIINWILYIVGVVSIVMIIVGGIRYAASAGNEKNVTAAKNTIIYALIGLAAAALSWVLVNFVFGALGGSQNEEATSFLF